MTVQPALTAFTPAAARRAIAGVDVTVAHDGRDPLDLRARLERLSDDVVQLEAIEALPDEMTARYVLNADIRGNAALVAQHIVRLARSGFDVVSTRTRYL